MQKQKEEEEKMKLSFSNYNPPDAKELDAQARNNPFGINRQSIGPQGGKGGNAFVGDVVMEESQQLVSNQLANINTQFNGDGFDLKD